MFFIPYYKRSVKNKKIQGMFNFSSFTFKIRISHELFALNLRQGKKNLYIVLALLTKIFKSNIYNKNTRVIISQRHMGNLVWRRPRVNQAAERLRRNSNHHLDEKDQEAAYNIWQRSSKTIDDLITYIQSQQSQQQNHEKVKLFITSLTNREKLVYYLQNLENYVLSLGSKQCKLNQDHKKLLIYLVHPKLENIWFLWNQLHYTSITPLHLHQRMFSQLQAETDFTYKLQLLYTVAGAFQTLPLQAATHHVDADRIIKQAVRINYPFLVTKDTITELFAHLIEHQVYVENTLYFCNFIKNLCEQLGTVKGISQCKDYIQRLYAIKGKNDLKFDQVHNYLQMSHTEDIQSGKIHRIIIEAGKQFLEIGYPYAMQLIFQTIIQSPQSILTQNQIHLYIYTRIYSLFTYSFEQINLQFKHLEKMSISNIIHLVLRDNNYLGLGKLQEIFKTVNELERKYRKESQLVEKTFDFENQIFQYVFSNYCNLQMCLQIISGDPSFLEVGPQFKLRQKKVLLKLKQYKFEAIIENQNLIKTVCQVHLSGTQVLKEISEKIQQILEIVRLVFMFGVNEKFSYVSVFYCPESQVQFEQNRKDQIQIIQQEKTLELFKTLISKFYISSDRNKKIILNSKSSNQIQVDLSKPQSIFQISQYLYDKILNKGLHSINEIHQIIFQHIFYFYRYDDAKAVLTNQNIISKFKINTEMLQIIVIENIVELIRKSNDLKKVINDINLQLKLIKDNKSVAAQSVKAMVKLVTYLSQNGIQLTSEEKNKMNMNLMYGILENYSDRIEILNFDTIYEDIKAINANQIIEHEQDFIMTNQLLKFKSKLAAKAFAIQKKKLGNQLIDEISRFDPPWLTTQLIEIFKNSISKIDKKIYGIALKACSKGSDLKYLMYLWKDQQGKERRKEKGFADIREYFETGRQYLVIEDSLIKNEENYRNYVAQCQFNDDILHLKKYQLFFVLLGSQPERAFHYALSVDLDPPKIYTFLKQGMKANIINPYQCISFLHKYFHFVEKIEREKLSKTVVGLYKDYIKIQFDRVELQNKLKELKKIKQKIISTELYIKILQAFICSQWINERFINTYFSNIQQNGKANLAYQVLFDEKSRKNLLIELREEPMGRSDIFTLDQVCKQILNLNLIQLCIFNLANISNTSDEMDEKYQNILHKIITLTTDKPNECKQIISKLIEKIFSIAKLVQILKYFQQRENPLYRQILKQRNLKVLQSLSSIELGQEFHGLIPTTYFENQIKFNPIWPLSATHQKILRSCWVKTNIFVLSKVMYFIYGMNTQIEKKIWSDYLQQHQDDELQQIKQKLSQE